MNRSNIRSTLLLVAALVGSTGLAPAQRQDDPQRGGTAQRPDNADARAQEQQREREQAQRQKEREEQRARQEAEAARKQAQADEQAAQRARRAAGQTGQAGQAGQAGEAGTKGQDGPQPVPIGGVQGSGVQRARNATPAEQDAATDAERQARAQAAREQRAAKEAEQEAAQRQERAQNARDQRAAREAEAGSQGDGGEAGTDAERQARAQAAREQRAAREAEQQRLEERERQQAEKEAAAAAAQRQERAQAARDQRQAKERLEAREIEQRRRAAESATKALTPEQREVVARLLEFKSGHVQRLARLERVEELYRERGDNEGLREVARLRGVEQRRFLEMKRLARQAITQEQLDAIEAYAEVPGRPVQVPEVGVQRARRIDGVQPADGARPVERRPVQGGNNP